MNEFRGLGGMIDGLKSDSVCLGPFSLSFISSSTQQTFYQFSRQEEAMQFCSQCTGDFQGWLCKKDSFQDNLIKLETDFEFSR